MSQSAEQIRSKMEGILSKMNGDSAFEQALRSDAASTLSELGLSPESLANSGSLASAGGGCGVIVLSTCVIGTSYSQ